MRLSSDMFTLRSSVPLNWTKCSSFFAKKYIFPSIWPKYPASLCLSTFFLFSCQLAVCCQIKCLSLSLSLSLCLSRSDICLSSGGDIHRHHRRLTISLSRCNLHRRDTLIGHAAITKITGKKESCEVGEEIRRLRWMIGGLF